MIPLTSNSLSLRVVTWWAAIPLVLLFPYMSSSLHGDFSSSTGTLFVEAFAPSFNYNNMLVAPLRSSQRMATSSNEAANKKKGFGKSPEPPKKTTTTTTTTTQEPAEQSTENQSATVEYPTPSAGVEALSRLRRQQAEKRNEELRQMRELKSVDRLLSEEPDAAVIPEKVAQRMGKRMLPFVGIPLFGVMGAFVAFWYLATYKNYEFQPALVAFSTIGILGVGLLGITYSVMSASWDVEVEGSALGWDEFKKNLSSIQDGLKRTRENAILREKMSSLPQEEIDDALQRFERKEQLDVKKTMNLKEKLEKDLE